MKLFNSYSNGLSRYLSPESGGEIFTSVVETATVNSISLWGSCISSKKKRSSGITILNSAKTFIPPGVNGRRYSFNSVDLYSVGDDPYPSSEQAFSIYILTYVLHNFSIQI